MDALVFHYKEIWIATTLVTILVNYEQNFVLYLCVNVASASLFDYLLVRHAEMLSFVHMGGTKVWAQGGEKCI